MKSHVEAALKRAAQIAARYGIASAPLHESEQLLWQKFDGDILRMHSDDVASMSQMQASSGESPFRAHALLGIS